MTECFCAENFSLIIFVFRYSVRSSRQQPEEKRRSRRFRTIFNPILEGQDPQRSRREPAAAPSQRVGRRRKHCGMSVWRKRGWGRARTRVGRFGAEEEGGRGGYRWLGLSWGEDTVFGLVRAIARCRERCGQQAVAWRARETSQVSTQPSDHYIYPANIFFLCVSHSHITWHRHRQLATLLLNAFRTPEGIFMDSSIDILITYLHIFTLPSYLYYIYRHF